MAQQDSFTEQGTGLVDVDKEDGGTRGKRGGGIWFKTSSIR